MTEILVGLIGIAFLILLIFMRFPIAFAMGIVGFVGFAYLNSLKTGLALVPRDLFEQFSSYSLSAITLFILMGYYAFSARIGERIFDCAYKLLGGIRGGLAISSIFASAIFGSICGSATATAATIGKLTIPEMRKYKYDDELSTGVLSSGGVLGILIPPSVIFLVYGILAEQSISKLFLSGILPGIILAALMSLAIFIICTIKPSLGPKGPSYGLKEKIKSALNIFDVLLLFVCVIGGLLLGFFTPTQAGGVGAAGALVIGLIRRELTWSFFINSSREALRTACMIILIIACATIFSHFIVVTTIPQLLATWITSLNMPPWLIIVLILFIYLLGGCFLDAIPLIIITIPVFYPIVLNLGYDPIWFGVIIVLVASMGLISPPIGMNVYVIKGIADDVPMERIFKGVIPFLLSIFVLIALLMIFPKIPLFLPDLLE